MYASVEPMTAHGSLYSACPAAPSRSTGVKAGVDALVLERSRTRSLNSSSVVIVSDLAMIGTMFTLRCSARMKAMSMCLSRCGAMK